MLLHAPASDIEPFASTSTRPRAATPSPSATALLDRLTRCSTTLRRPARRFVVSSPLVWRLHGAALRAARSRRRADPRPRRRALQAAADRRARLRRADSAPTPIAPRRSSPSAAASSATWPGSPRPPICAASRWSTCRRRCWRRSTARSAARSASTIALGKNLIGAFYQPHAVVIDPSVLGTLPRREFRAGLYEVIKYGMTSSPALFERIGRERDGDLRARARRRCCRSSPSRAASRPTSSRRTNGKPGLRRILNFGHTAGHALEAVTKYRRFRHGEAVALRHARRRRTRRRARRAGRARPPGARGPDRQPRSAAADRGRPDRARSSTRCSTTRRWSPGRLHFVLPTGDRRARRSWTT